MKVVERQQRGLTEAQKARLRELTGMLPAGVQDRLRADPRGVAQAITVDLKNRKKNFPSIDFVPNIAQERALSCLARPHPAYGDYPKKVMFCAANGVGKTCDIAAVLLPGMCLGPQFVNRDYCNWQYFYDIEKLRAKRKLKIRLVCDAKDMKENNGSLYQQIEKWIPTAKFKDKLGDFFTTVVIGDTIIDVKTHAMGKVAHAGPDYDAVIFNEPAPEDIYQENISRTRMGGRAFLFLTPLNQAAYLARDIMHPEGPEGEVYFCEGAIWDNCADIPGTRGVLSRRDIEFLCREWKKKGEHEFQARAYGKFTSFAGVIFEVYTDHVHLIDPFPIPSDWNLYHLCDPHETKPPFALWIARDPLNNSYVVAEYPNQQWDQILSTPLTIRHFCREFDLIEAGKNGNFPYMPRKKADYEIGDPNRMPTKIQATGRTIGQEYALYGRNYDLSAADDITLGHDRVRDMLYYDRERDVSATNSPHMYVFRTCKNVNHALKEYMTDPETGKLIDTWKCPIDLLRYYADKAEPWNRMLANGAGSGDDYDAIDRGRDPENYDCDGRYQGYREPEEVVYPGVRW